jgi:hypothetical protein
MIIFETLGKFIDKILTWLFDFKDNDIQLIIWSGLVGALLVFIIEYLRKPRIDIDLLLCSFDFNLPKLGNQNAYLPSKNWKIRVNYKKTFLNKILFRYPISNLKIIARITSEDERIRKEYVLKADSNPNAYEEKDVPQALSKINLSKEESELYPLLNKSELGWLPFEVWSIFIDEKLRDYLISGTYKIEIIASADQLYEKKKFKIYINQTLEKL